MGCRSRQRERMGANALFDSGDPVGFAGAQPTLRGLRGLQLANGQFRSIAFPLIGAGTGSFSPQRCEQIVREQMDATPFDGEIVIVRVSQR